MTKVPATSHGSPAPPPPHHHPYSPTPPPHPRPTQHHPISTLPHKKKKSGSHINTNTPPSPIIPNPPVPYTNPTCSPLQQPITPPTPSQQPPSLTRTHTQATGERMRQSRTDVQTKYRRFHTPYRDHGLISTTVGRRPTTHRHEHQPRTVERTTTHERTHQSTFVSDQGKAAIYERLSCLKVICITSTEAATRGPAT